MNITIASEAPSRDGLDCRARSPSAVFAGAVLSVVMVLAHTSESRAASLLIDQVPGSGGSLSYDGAGGPLVGTDIVFEQITGDSTPLNAGSTLTLVDGRLNFSTGPNLVEPSPIYAWGGGGSFVLTADAVLDSALVDVIAPANDTVILTGTFLGASTFAVIGIVGFDQIAISAFGVDEKHPDILSYFGLNLNNFRFAHSDISATDLVIDSGTQGFSTSVAEADIVNTPVPEPSAAILAATALIGLVAFGWRRRRSNRRTFTSD